MINYTPFTCINDCLISFEMFAQIKKNLQYIKPILSDN